jgi:predicted aspartyl protease
LRIPLDVRYLPKLGLRQVRIVAFFSCFDLGIGQDLFFLVDTGAGQTLISERDATVLGVDYEKLELLKEPIFGIGGPAPAYRINSECKITFVTSDKRAYVVSLPSVLATKVVIEDVAMRKRVFNETPSLLGMEVILDRFKLVTTKAGAYLEA